MISIYTCTNNWHCFAKIGFDAKRILISTMWHHMYKCISAMFEFLKYGLANKKKIHTFKSKKISSVINTCD